MRANKTKTFFWADIFFWKFGCLPPIGGLEYMQIFSPIAPLERKIWAFEVCLKLPCSHHRDRITNCSRRRTTNQIVRKSYVIKKKKDQTRRRRTIALHPVLHYVPAGCKQVIQKIWRQELDKHGSWVRMSVNEGRRLWRMTMTLKSRSIRKLSTH